MNSIVLSRLLKSTCENRRRRKKAWFKNSGFWVTIRTLSAAAQVVQRATWFWLIAARSAVAEHFQPVGVRLAGQQLGGTLVNAFRVFAAQKAAMVEEEL